MKIEKSKFPLRIIVLPFVMIITFCYSMWQLTDFWFNFVVYGGEFIALTKTRTKATIAETFDKVQEMVKEKEKRPLKETVLDLDYVKSELKNSGYSAYFIETYCDHLQNLHNKMNPNENAKL